MGLISGNVFFHADYLLLTQRATEGGREGGSGEGGHRRRRRHGHRRRVGRPPRSGQVRQSLATAAYSATAWSNRIMTAENDDSSLYFTDGPAWPGFSFSAKIAADHARCVRHLERGRKEGSSLNEKPISVISIALPAPFAPAPTTHTRI